MYFFILPPLTPCFPLEGETVYIHNTTIRTSNLDEAGVSATEKIFKYKAKMTLGPKAEAREQLWSNMTVPFICPYSFASSASFHNNSNTGIANYIIFPLGLTS